MGDRGVPGYVRARQQRPSRGFDVEQEQGGVWQAGQPGGREEAEGVIVALKASEVSGNGEGLIELEAVHPLATLDHARPPTSASQASRPGARESARAFRSCESLSVAGEPVGRPRAHRSFENTREQPVDRRLMCTSWALDQSLSSTSTAIEHIDRSRCCCPRELVGR